jgi:hypothetical protein
MVVIGERVRAAVLLELGITPLIGPARPPDLNLRVDPDDTQYYALLFDLASDKASIEQFCLHVKSVAPTKSEAFTRLVCIRPALGATGAMVETIALDSLSHCGIPLASCIIGCTDGCPSMIGVHSGALTRISQRQSGVMIMINCKNHSLALGSADASEAVDYIAHNFKSTLTSLFVHILYSPKRLASLKSVQLEFGKAARLVKNGDTRWLSFHQTVISIRQSLAALIITLTLEAHGSGQGAAMAGGLANTLGSEHFLRMLLLWSDVMPILAQFSVLLQSENLDFQACREGLVSALSAVDAIRSNPGQ